MSIRVKSMVLAALALLSGAVMAAQPNVVLFLADDLGYGELGCYGGPSKTPNLDAFAKQGLRLTQCYSASGVCSPSRSALLTGRTPHRNGVYTWIAEGSEVHLRSSEVALPALLKRAGYATCHVGKWHLNGKFNKAEQPQPGEHGYEWWMATQNNAAPSHANPKNFVRNGTEAGVLQGYSAPLAVTEAIAWLKEKRDPAKPFFLTVWTHEPHYPIGTDPQFASLYPAELDAETRAYRGNVSQLDHAFGQLMKALEEVRAAENTLVWFTSDNGPEGDGGKGPGRGSTGGLRGRKRAMYEGGIRVPGIVRLPGRIVMGSERDTPINGTDFLPTICALTGVAAPNDRVLDGANVLPLLEGKVKQVERPKPLYWRLHMAPGKQIAMRVGDWKILANQALDTLELYNIREDASEANELSQKEPRRMEELKAELLKLNAEIDAEGPDWWKRLSDSGGTAKKGKE